jgi:multiple sugar transport system substrate-binding protein
MNRRLSRRGFLRLSTGVAATSLLAACAVPSPAPAGAPGEGVAAEAVTLRHHARTGVQGDFYEEEKGIFHEAHPNIQVVNELTPDEDYSQKLLTLAAAGDLGDSYWTAVFYVTYPFGSSGVSADLNPYIEASDFPIDQFFEVAVNQNTWDGRLIGMPVSGHPGLTTMWTNVTAFEEAGVPLAEWEWTFEDQWLDAVREVSLDTDGDGVTDRFGYQFDYTAQNAYLYLKSWGGDWIDPESRAESWINKEESMAGLRFMRDLVEIHKVSPAPEQVVEQMFVNGLTASWSNGIWNFSTLTNTVEGFDWDGPPMPSGPAGRGTFVGVDSVAINSQGQTDAAFEWTAWLASPESALRGVDWGFPPPFHKGAWEDPKLAENPIFQHCRRWLEAAFEGWTLPHNARAQEFVRTVTQAMTVVLDPNSDFEQEVATLHANLQAVLDKEPV